MLQSCSFHSQTSSLVSHLPTTSKRSKTCSTTKRHNKDTPASKSSTQRTSTKEVSSPPFTTNVFSLTSAATDTHVTPNLSSLHSVNLTSASSSIPPLQEQKESVVTPIPPIFLLHIQPSTCVLHGGLHVRPNPPNRIPNPIRKRSQSRSSHPEDGMGLCVSHYWYREGVHDRSEEGKGKERECRGGRAQANDGLQYFLLSSTRMLISIHTHAWS